LPSGEEEHKKMNRWIILHGVVFLAFVFLTGCQTTPTSKVETTIKTSSEVNPDPSGRASPVVVVVYELRSVSAFNSTDFFSLYDNSDTVLAKDLQRREAFQLTPGESRELKMEFQPGSHFLGVIAAFRNLENAQWRASVEAPPGRTTRFNIQLDPLAVSIVPIKR